MKIDELAQMKTIFRIIPTHAEGAFIEVSLDEDDMVYICAGNDFSRAYFGDINFRIEKSVALKLAEALRTLT